MHTVKCFQVLLFNTNDSIKNQWLAYTQLNDVTVLFQTIQFSISTVFFQHIKSLTIRLFSVISKTLLGESYTFAEVQSGYSAAPADWVLYDCNNYTTCISLYKCLNYEFWKYEQIFCKIEISKFQSLKRCENAVIFFFCRYSINLVFWVRH